MYFGSLHILDLLIIAGYLGTVVYIGKRASAGVKSEEGFFLAGRKLGKLYQFFLSFGNATEPQGAVSTASFVYQQGAPGAWLSFQTVFMNPYFWFMNVWFRRVRLTTLSDLFEDRFGSRGLSLFYAVFQILVACVFLGFGNVTAYKIASSLVVKPEVQWTAADRAAVEGFRELKQLEQLQAAGTLPVEQVAPLDLLRERNARGELHSYITLLNDAAFYALFTLVVGSYVVLGGMTAAAVNEGLQSVLIIVFSILLIPTGLHAIGGWHALGQSAAADVRAVWQRRLRPVLRRGARRHFAGEHCADRRAQSQHGDLRLGEERVRGALWRLGQLSQAHHDHPLGVRGPHRRRGVRAGGLVGSGYHVGRAVEPAAGPRPCRPDAGRRPGRHHVHVGGEGAGDLLALRAERLPPGLAGTHPDAGGLLRALDHRRGPGARRSLRVAHGRLSLDRESRPNGQHSLRCECAADLFLAPAHRPGRLVLRAPLHGGDPRYSLDRRRCRRRCDTILT